MNRKRYASTVPMKDNVNPHEIFMREALAEAQKAYAANEVPIGAVLVDINTQKIVARAHNLTITQADPTAHAEILALRAVCATQQVQRIPEYILYVTLEPCPMCAAAISYARIAHIYFGALDVKSGGLLSGPCLSQNAALHHKPGVTGGILADESATLMKKFFQERR